MPPPTKGKLTKHSINTLTKLVGLISSQRKTGRLNVTLYTALNRLQLALIGGCNKYLTTIPVINPFCHNCVSMWTPVDWFYTLFAFTVDSLYSCWKAFNMEVGNCSFSDRRASLRLRTYNLQFINCNLQFIIVNCTIYNSQCPDWSGHCPDQSSSSTSDSGNNSFLIFFSVWILHCTRALKLEKKKVGLFCYKSWSNFMQLLVMGVSHIAKHLIRRRYPHILSHVM